MSDSKRFLLNHLGNLDAPTISQGPVILGTTSSSNSPLAKAFTPVSSSVPSLSIAKFEDNESEHSFIVDEDEGDEEVTEAFKKQAVARSKANSVTSYSDSESPAALSTISIQREVFLKNRPKILPRPQVPAYDGVIPVTPNSSPAVKISRSSKKEVIWRDGKEPLLSTSPLKNSSLKVDSPHHSTPKSKGSSPNTKKQRSTSDPPTIFKSWTSKSRMNMELISHLFQDFVDDDNEQDTAALQLSRILRLDKPPTLSKYDHIHSVVDFSNIYIGYLEAIKRKLNNPAKLDRKYRAIDVESLFTILERGRYVERRSLAGSSNNMEFPESFLEDAEKDWGYKLVLKERVVDRAKSNKNGTSADHSKVAMKEQGVDEALINVIYDCTLDYHSTPCTIIVATGDGAAANNFGIGFANVIEKALALKFHIELVSWRANINKKYLEMDERYENLKIIYLDPYLDYLLAWKK